ncbi:MAG TPA: nicotinate-nucleotide adenylyltransferase [bacterium]|nr:nicotinate-nucleotide adenylyltransferase [bacterium]
MDNKKERTDSGEKISIPQKDSSEKFRVGIMGGTFNPIHYGHLLAAEQARCKFGMDRVIFVPAGDPPHKEGMDIAPREHRYLMTVLAVATNPHFRVSRFEIDRNRISYSIDTIRYFIEHYKDRNPEIFFITGLDAVMEILTWSEPDDILKLSTIIAATRPGYDVSQLENRLGTDLMMNVRILRASALAISSTDIRNRVVNGLPIKYLLPESVEQYIENHRLYQKPREASL